MHKTLVVCAAANFKAGRPNGMHPEAIVLHRTGGTAEQRRTLFLDATTSISAHYVVAKDANVTQYVKEEDTAFHAGIAINPTWKGIKPKVNPNFYTVGIELEGADGEAFSDEQLNTCAALVAEIAARHRIPLDDEHLVLHGEIRSSRTCPGDQFSRADFLQRALLAASGRDIHGLTGEVGILKDANLREKMPSSSARVVSVLRANTDVRVNGFTLKGETINGNNAWFQTPEGNFLWAGSTTMPEPRPQGEEEPEDPAVAFTSHEDAVVADASKNDQSKTVVRRAPSRIGIEEVDRLFSSEPCDPLALRSAGEEAIVVIQDLLAAHGYKNLPSIFVPTYGTATPATLTALLDFQRSSGLKADGLLNAETMRQLLTRPMKSPLATKAHFCLLLGRCFDGMDRLLTLTAQMEGAGKFAAFNANSDRAGLSFGMIQWAQSPRRLLGLVKAFKASNPQLFIEMFADGNPDVAQGLLAHLAKPNGGVVPKIGVTTDPKFDLIADPWKERFLKSAQEPEYQNVQIEQARSAFEASLNLLGQYDSTRVVKSERGVAFMLDVANQCGDGPPQPRPANRDCGAAGKYRQVFRPGMSEEELLHGIAKATIDSVPESCKPGTQARRKLFLITPALSDKEFLFASSEVAFTATA